MRRNRASCTCLTQRRQCLMRRPFPFAGENIHTYVKPSEYMNKLSAHSLIRITGVANVQETDQLWSQDDDFGVHKPQLTVTVNSHVSRKQSTCFLVTYHIIDRCFTTTMNNTFRLKASESRPFIKK